MPPLLAPLAALLLSVGVLILGNGLLGTLLSVRAQLESFATPLIGVLGAAYFTGFGIGCVIGPYVIRRVGHIRAFAAFCAIIAAAVLVHAVFPQPLVWLLLRILVGLCFAGLYTVVESWLNAAADNQSRGRILSIYVVISLSAMTGGQLLLKLDDPAGFELFSLVAILVAIALVPVSLTRAAAPAPPIVVRLRPFRLYRLSPVGLVGCFIVGITNGAFWTLAPAFLSGIGRDTSMVATFMAVAVLGGALAQWPLGRLSDHVDRRWVIFAGSVMASVTGFALYTWGGGEDRLLLVLGGAFGASALSMYAVCIAHANDHVDRRDAVEASSSLLLIYAIGAVVGPICASLVMSGEAGPSGLFLATSGAHLTLAAFTLLRMRLRAAVPVEERSDFVAVQPRSSPQVFELDPRTEPVEEADNDAVSQSGASK